VLGYAAVAALALGLRLWFILGASTITPRWDALGYWNAMLGVREAICRQFSYCVPGGFNVPVPELDVALRDAVMGHNGWLPLLGGVLTVLPAEPLSILVLYAILGALVCLMVVGIARRWGAPLWVALVAGVLQAIYIPSITGDGAVLQQPVIRFLLVTAVWAYTWAFTSSEWRVPVAVALGTGATLAFGFSALTNRPRIWLIQVAVLGLTLAGPSLRALRNTQLVGTAASLVLVLALSGLLYSATGLNDSWSVPLTGLSTEGSAAGLSTVTSFDHFWPPDAWPSHGHNPGGSLVGELVRSPLEFARWWAYSLFSNWRLPDYLYFQNFVLDLEGQRQQHAAFVVMGLLGLAGLLSSPGRRRRTVLLILLIGAAMSLVYSAISVEPRRLSVLSPFLALGAGIAIWGLWSLLGALRLAAGSADTPRWLRRTVAALGAIALISIVPLGLTVRLIPDMAGPAHTIHVLVQSAALVFGIAATAALARRLAPHVRPALPAAFLLVVVVVVTVANLLDTEWRAWSQTTAGPVRQTLLRALPARAHLQPWLVIDAADAGALRSAAVYVNDRLVKPSGTPAYVWRAGVPPLWWVYGSALEVANPPPPLRTWMGVPLPRDLDRTAPLTFEIRPGDRPLGLWGDYLDAPDAHYFGPLVDPGADANSFWRWQWNGVDPRIPAAQSFGGLDYTSSYSEPDSGPSSGTQTTSRKPPGLFRIFLTQVAFGPVTNALQPHEANLSSRLPSCQGSDLVAVEYLGQPFVCSTPDRVTFHSAAGAELGSAAKELLRSPFEDNSLLATMSTSDGRIELIGVTRGVQASGTIYGLYIANFYAAGGELTYSAAFRLLLPPAP
jgi:hypothetical protein